jgi:hypothetical protein
MTTWKVVLKDGTSFIGKRTLKAMWYEGLLTTCYKIMESASLPKGSIVSIEFGSMLYKIKM